MAPWLRLLRISNLPTVWSNVLLGVVAGGQAQLPTYWWVGAPLRELRHQLEMSMGMMLAMSCLYLAGMALNDVLDVKHDRVDAPHRPIVLGQVSRSGAALVTATLLAVGLLLPIVQGSIPLTMSVVVLAASIVAYDVLHQRWPASRLLMGFCRAMLVVAASTLAATPFTPRWWLFVGTPAVVLMVYVWLVSAIAATEDAPPLRISGRRVPRRTVVMRMLAGMPLLDAAFLWVMGFWPAALVSVACAGLTNVWHRWVSGT